MHGDHRESIGCPWVLKVEAQVHLGAGEKQLGFEVPKPPSTPKRAPNPTKNLPTHKARAAALTAKSPHGPAGWLCMGTTTLAV